MPELRQYILAGEINIASCPHCGASGYTENPFVVNDPLCERLIFFIPEELEPGAQASAVQMLYNLLPVAFDPPRPDYFSNPLVVSDWEELLGWLAEGSEEDAEADASLEDALAAFITARGWQKKQQVITEHPELFS
jgi:hypothetical protein